jgi:hypothetical protein
MSYPSDGIPDDDALAAEVADLITRADPVPAGLVQSTQDAMADWLDIPDAVKELFWKLLPGWIPGGSVSHGTVGLVNEFLLRAVPILFNHWENEVRASGRQIITLPEPTTHTADRTDWTIGDYQITTRWYDRDEPEPWTTIELCSKGVEIGFDITEARQVAAALLAAADEAEQREMAYHHGRDDRFRRGAL